MNKKQISHDAFWVMDKIPAGIQTEETFLEACNNLIQALAFENEKAAEIKKHLYLANFFESYLKNKKIQKNA
jgi:hypothetical protein